MRRSMRMGWRGHARLGAGAALACALIATGTAATAATSNTAASSSTGAASNTGATSSSAAISATAARTTDADHSQGLADHGQGLIVPTADGVLQGTRAGTTDEFLGVPYAAPPVGGLRWRPPQPAAPWRGIRQATGYAPHCAQPSSPFGVASTSEDCLYLNVFTPAGANQAGTHGRDLPVMVWIHGGALVVGESNDYNPAELVRHGVIVVTINYRLGLFGFLADAALADRPGGPSGNYG